MLPSHSLPDSLQKKRPPNLPLPSRPIPNSVPRSPTLTLSTISRPSLSASHTRSLSASARPRPYQSIHDSLPISSPPTITSFQQQLQPGTTHAGGIQPSLSFFHPSRPTQSSSRPSSVESYVEAAPEPDLFQLAPLSKQNSRSSDEGSDVISAPHTAKERPLSSRYKSSTSPPPAQSPTIYHRNPSPSPSILFNPTPPKQPLWNLPMTENNRLVRKYEQHPSRNRFFLRGYLLTGGDSPVAFIASLTLVLTIAGVWFGTTIVWWWHEESPAVAAVGVYMLLLTISTMLTTALQDPGILPRNLDPDPPYPATSPQDGTPRAPLPRDLKVRIEVVRVKYCPTCKIYRPPRSSHCKMCDNCVDGCDHHCQWVNNCIGHRNYTTFFAFLLSASLTLCLVIVTSAIHIYLVSRREHIDIRDALGRAAGSAVAFSLSVVVIWPVAALFSYHLRLLLLNITTIEQIRFSAHKTLAPNMPAPSNPFTHGTWLRNLSAVLCRPRGLSWLDAHGVVVHDARDINPGLVRGGAWDEEDLERQ